MNANQNDELDLIVVFKTVWINKKIIIYTTLFLTVIGIIFSLISPNSYSSSTVFIPQNQENSTNSSLSGVASLVGINLSSNTNSSEIPPSMYPQVSASPKFKRMLLSSFIDLNRTKTLDDFLMEYYNLEELEKKSIQSIYVSEIEEKKFKIINSLISVDVNIKEGFITIFSEMPVAEYAATIANNSKEILQKIIIENKIESANQNLKFSQDQLKEKMDEFNDIQSKLAFFKDSNLNIVNSSIKNEQDKLEAEFQIINAVVTELAKQVEQAKMKVSRDTPVFSTIREAVIPNVRTSPKRKQIVVLFTFIGIMSSILFVFLRDPVRKIINEIIV